MLIVSTDYIIQPIYLIIFIIETQVGRIYILHVAYMPARIFRNFADPHITGDIYDWNKSNIIKHSGPAIKNTEGTQRYLRLSEGDTIGKFFSVAFRALTHIIFAAHYAFDDYIITPMMINMLLHLLKIYEYYYSLYVDTSYTRIFHTRCFCNIN